MRILRLLLRFLPSEMRLEFGAELLLTVEDQWRAARQTHGPIGLCGFWLRQWIAVVGCGLRLRLGFAILGAADRRGRQERGGLQGTWKDVQHSVRALAARPGFTAVAVLTLALGIGATASMFGAVRSILLRALPYEKAEEVVVLRQSDARDGSLRDGISAANLRDLAGMSQTLSVAAFANDHGFTLLEGGRAISLRSWLVSEGFFDAIGGRTEIGRTFLPEEHTSGNHQVVVLGHHTWRSRFGGDPAILGRELVLDGAAHTVVGVLPEGFKYPAAAEIWAPRVVEPWDDAYRASAGMDGVARLAPGARLDQAQAELDQLAADLEHAHPDANAHLGLHAIPLRQHLFGDVKSPMTVLLGAVGLVLLIAIANVAGLQLARGATRVREYALRGALGASSQRLLRLVSIESLLLAFGGGLLGLALAVLGTDLIRLLGPTHLPRIDEVRVDIPVLVFAWVTAVGSALAAGIAPALHAARVDPHRALAEGSRGSTRGPSVKAFRDRLVVAEIALALMLSIGAGLLVRSFDRLLDNTLGFDPEGRLAVQIFAYDAEHQPNQDFFRRAGEEIRALPGVEAVGLTTYLPLADDRSVWSGLGSASFRISGRDAAGGNAPAAAVSVIDDGYAQAMGIALHAGRDFATQDGPSSLPVAMVNEAFARRYFPGREPVGARLALERRGERPREIVGVLADVRPRGFESEPRPEIYLPLAQRPSGSLTFVVATSADPTLLIRSVEEAIRTADPRQAIWAALPMNDLLSDWTRQRRFNMALLVIFAALALSLAAIGVYGLMAFSVEQRVNELGIRLALGGQSRDLFAMVLHRGLTLAAAGVGFGLVGSLAVTRLLQGMLFGIAPFDLLTFVVLSVLVFGVAALATLLPARRATQVEPVAALRAD